MRLPFRRPHEVVATRELPPRSLRRYSERRLRHGFAIVDERWRVSLPPRWRWTVNATAALAVIAVWAAPWCGSANAGIFGFDRDLVTAELGVAAALAAVPVALAVLLLTFFVDRARSSFQRLVRDSYVLQAFSATVAVLLLGLAVLAGYGRQTPSTNSPTSAEIPAAGLGYAVAGLALMVAIALLAYTTRRALLTLRPGAIAHARATDLSNLVAQELVYELRSVLARDALQPWVSGHSGRPAGWATLEGKEALAQPATEICELPARRRLQTRLRTNGVVHDVRLRRLLRLSGGRPMLVTAVVGQHIRRDRTPSLDGPRPFTVATVCMSLEWSPLRALAAARCWTLRANTRPQRSPYRRVNDLAHLGELGSHLQDLLQDAAHAARERRTSDFRAALDDVLNLFARAARATYSVGYRLDVESEPTFTAVDARAAQPGFVTTLEYPLREVLRAAAAGGSPDLFRAVRFFVDGLDVEASVSRSLWLWELGRHIAEELINVAGDFPDHIRDTLRAELIESLSAERTQLELRLSYESPSIGDRTIELPTWGGELLERRWSVEGPIWASQAVGATARSHERMGKQLVDDADAATLARLLAELGADFDFDHGNHDMPGAVVNLLRTGSAQDRSTYAAALQVVPVLVAHLEDARDRRSALPLGLLWWALAQQRALSDTNPIKAAATGTTIAVLLRHLSAPADDLTIGPPRFITAWVVAAQAPHRWAPYFDWQLFDQINGSVVRSNVDLDAGFVLSAAAWLRGDGEGREFADLLALLRAGLSDEVLLQHGDRLTNRGADLTQRLPSIAGQIPLSVEVQQVLRAWAQLRGEADERRRERLVATPLRQDTQSTTLEMVRERWRQERGILALLGSWSKEDGAAAQTSTVLDVSRVPLSVERSVILPPDAFVTDASRVIARAQAGHEERIVVAALQKRLRPVSVLPGELKDRVMATAENLLAAGARPLVLLSGSFTMTQLLGVTPTFLPETASRLARALSPQAITAFAGSRPGSAIVGVMAVGGDEVAVARSLYLGDSSVIVFDPARTATWPEPSLERLTLAIEEPPPTRDHDGYLSEPQVVLQTDLTNAWGPKTRHGGKAFRLSPAPTPAPPSSAE